MKVENKWGPPGIYRAWDISTMTNGSLPGSHDGKAGGISVNYQPMVIYGRMITLRIRDQGLMIIINV